MKVIRLIQILTIAGLLTVGFSCEKEEALEKVESSVEQTQPESGDPVLKSAQEPSDSNSGGSDGDGDVITDPGNDDDYDKEDPNAGGGNA
tara:strand:+ start:211 stop:480 length:270 start_codon:yes stop_codon:yes gene_type:complete